MPDEVQRPAIDADGNPADVLDQALEFRVAFGAWPRTWAEFVLGAAHLGRASAAEKLRIADAVAATRGKPEAWLQWVADLKHLAGV